MATIKVKFRASTIEDKAGVIYYQVIHNQLVRQIGTRYKIFTNEWDEVFSKVITPIWGDTRYRYIESINSRIKLDTNRLKQIIKRLDKNGINYTSINVVEQFEHRLNGTTLFDFMRSTIERLIELNRHRTAETYRTALNSFMRFRDGDDLLLTDITSDLMMDYEAYLKSNNVIMNTISFYMRIIRAVYNRAVEQELAEQQFPFKKVYTGVDKTVKRALPLKNIKQLKALELTHKPDLMYVRDMFLFSFYTRGMSFIDMAFLRKRDLLNGVLTYRRRKTGQQLHIKWERCMQAIVDKYSNFDTEYLLPIITLNERNERVQYQNARSLINRKLKNLANEAGLKVPLTMYVARHSWASIAKSRNIPLSVISEGMGHDSEATTQIYLASLDTSVVDRANNLIIKLL